MNPAFDQEFPSPGRESGTRLNQTVTVTLPSEIDTTNASQVGDTLARSLSGGAAVVIADATETIFCDCGGVRALLDADRQAVAAGTGLRVVTAASPTVRRIFDLTGATQVLDLYPTLAAAWTGRPRFPEPAAVG